MSQPSSQPKKTLGQHWLEDQASLEAMCDAAAVQAGDAVLEIGPGQGTLTEKLLNRQAEVIALEYDEELIPFLQNQFADLLGKQLSVEAGDIRTYDLGNLPANYKIVANIPYYLTANLMRILTDPKTHKPKIAALLMQKEVAERIAAQPGDIALLSVVTQFYYEVDLGQLVTSELFIPPPKVDSQVLILKLRPEPLFSDIDSKQFLQLLKAGFSQRRKTLLNSLSGGLHLGRTEVEAICSQAGIDTQRRAQTLSLQEWHKLYKTLNT